jgi:hypothetical protein
MRTQTIVCLLILCATGAAWAVSEGGSGIGEHSFTTINVGNTGLVVGTSTPFSDATGTLTLQNIDAIDATTETTLESAIDTLDALTAVNVSGGTLEVPNGTDLPASCSVGELFVDSDDDSCADVGGGAGALCACTATNTWVVAAGA